MFSEPQSLFEIYLEGELELTKGLVDEAKAKMSFDDARKGRINVDQMFKNFHGPMG